MLGNINTQLVEANYQLRTMQKALLRSPAFQCNVEGDCCPRTLRKKQVFQWATPYYSEVRYVQKLIKSISCPSPKIAIIVYVVIVVTTVIILFFT